MAAAAAAAAAAAVEAGAAPAPAPAAPPAYNPSSAGGKQLLNAAFSGGQQQVVFNREHIVPAEYESQYGIISVPAGAIATLVQGDLTNGLGGQYADYVEVEYAGRTGKVSRKVLALYQAGPPPAIGGGGPPPALM